MGIANLNKFLRGKCPDVFRKIKLDELSTLKGTVDISLYIFKYKTVFGDNWLNALFHLLVCLRQNNIHACFIYDTSAPKEKDAERQRRKEQKAKLDDKLANLVASLEKAQLTGEIDTVLIEFNKALPSKKSLLVDTGEKQLNLKMLEYEISKKCNQSASICEEDFIVSKELLNVLCIPWFQAEMEAETTCADLCLQGQAHIVFSDDTDVLCYGAPYTVTKVNTADNTGILVSHSDILTSLEISHDQFIDFCIMCGTDYNKNIPKVGPETAFKLIKKFGSIEDIAKSGVDISILNHTRTRELFKDYKKASLPVPLCKTPNFSDVEVFLAKLNIRTNIQKMKKCFGPQEIIIDE
jgi:5'-3' exonuclease